jgi:hypothetical protein
MSTSATVIQTVNKAASTTTNVSSKNPSRFNELVTFSATVKSSTSGTPGGTVTFKDGTTTFGTGILNLSGMAGFSTSKMGVGAHSITAAYGGNGNFLASTSSALTQTVNQAGSTTTLASSKNPSSFHLSITLTATVKSSTSGTPSGTVTFKDGTVTLGPGTLNSSGVATLKTTALSVGSHSLTAVYGGNANFSGSTSTALTQIVNKTSTTAKLVSSKNPSTFGQSVTLTATISSTTSGTPTGVVTLKDSMTTLATVGLDSSGRAALVISTLSKGSHSITAVYGGDGNFTGITSAVLKQKVN